MTETERKNRILRMAVYIASGRSDKDPGKYLSRDLAEEISSLPDYSQETGPDPGWYCIDLGASLEEMDEDGSVWIRYPVNDKYRNGLGNLQGGLLASLIDNAMGILVVPFYGSFLTMNLDTNYFLPVSKEFDQIVIKAEIVKPGKRTKYLRAEVYRSDGKLAALAGSNVMMVRKKG